MKSQLAKAKDKWLLSAEGEAACHGIASGQYLRNRLVTAFLAGYNVAEERIQDLEERIQIALGGIEALSTGWDEEVKRDIEAIKQTLEQAKDGVHTDT